MTIDKSGTSVPSRVQMCLTNRGQSIFRDLFRLDEIRLHVDAPKLWTASEDKILQGPLKDLGTE
jgi:hypothetical protein